MEKSRLEAFTDGIFAIVVTLLVLDIHLPDDTTASNLDTNLIHIVPSFSTYVLSYLIVGMYWIFHHSASQMFKSIDTRIIWLNIVHVMFIGLIPFSTSMLSKFTFAPWAIALYGINLLAINLAGWLVMTYLYHHQNLTKGDFTPKVYTAQRHTYIKIASLYAIGILLGFVYPQASIYVYIFVTLYLIFGTLFPQYSWRRRLVE